MIKVIENIMWQWGVRCFGADHMLNPHARALRLVEEAIELCQAVGVPKKQVEQAVTVVYQRTRGSPIQEIGGVLVTSIVMCRVVGTSLENALEKEVLRCLSRPPEDFSKRNEEKNALGLSGDAYGPAV